MLKLEKFAKASRREAKFVHELEHKEPVIKPCTSRFVDPAQLAEELDRLYGSKLHPVRCSLRERKPVIFGFRGSI